jgi:hypothetical protein
MRMNSNFFFIVISRATLDEFIQLSGNTILEVRTIRWAG